MTREEAIDWLARMKSNTVNHTLEMPLWWNEPLAEALDMAIKALEQEPKTGHWISHIEHCKQNNLLPSGLGSYFWCSECNCGIDSKNFARVNYNYCPSCGADMRGTEE